MLALAGLADGNRHLWKRRSPHTRKQTVTFSLTRCFVHIYQAYQCVILLTDIILRKHSCRTIRLCWFSKNYLRALQPTSGSQDVLKLPV